VTILYGIPNCDTVKKARTWLDQNNQAFSFHDVRKDGISTQLVEDWCQRSDWQNLVNKRSTTWKQLDSSVRDNLSRDNVTKLLVEHPTLIKRPVLDYETGLEIGFKEANYQTIFSA